MEVKQPQTYHDLDVYRLAFALGVQCHKASMKLPKYELWEEGSQLRRSAKAVGAMIAEGFGRRNYKADFIRYLTYAQGELNEATHHLQMLLQTGAMEAEVGKGLLAQADELGRKLHRFMEAVGRGHRTQRPQPGGAGEAEQS